MDRVFRHPLFLAGFRPFFTLAFVAGVVFPLAWVLLFSGLLTLPATALSPLQWHVHEMIFGFGWAVLGGFLLTASKNWVQIPGRRERALRLAGRLRYSGARSDERVESAKELRVQMLPALKCFGILRLTLFSERWMDCRYGGARRPASALRSVQRATCRAPPGRALR